MADDTLSQLRNKIDVIDESIVELLEHRMKVTDEVGTYKRTYNIPILQKGREDALKDRLKNLAMHPVLKERIGTIFQTIIDTSKLSMSTLKK